VQIGVRGHFKRGHWAEVQAEISAGQSGLAAELEVISRDGDGAAAAFVGPQVKLAPQETATLTTVVKMGPPRSGMQLRIREGEKILAQFDISDASLNGDRINADKTWSKAHRSTSVVIATLGSPGGVAEAIELLQRHYADEVVEVPLSEATGLPTTWRGYDAIDCLAVVASEENPLADVTPAQRAALLDWLRMGGRLLLVAGEGAAAIFEPDSPWSSLAPGSISELESLNTDAGLRMFTGEGVELDLPVKFWGITTSPKMVVVGESGTASIERPLVVDAPFGFGRASLVLLDLARPPLNDWPGRGRLIAQLIAGEQLRTEQHDTPRGGRMTHLGYRDLSGQLRMSLDQYADVTPTHFYPVAGALLIYLLLLGPGAYFLLRRATPRAMQLAWVLLPLLVIGFSVAAMALGRASHGTATKVNHIEIVDLDHGKGLQKGTFWTSLFTPSAESFDVKAKPQTLPDARIDDAQLAWQALPGEGLGGVDAPPLASGALQPYIVRAGGADLPASIQRLPLALASSKILAGSWRGTVPTVTDASQLRRGKLREIEGSFRNLAPVNLTHAYLAHGEYIYRALGEMKPGAIVDVAQLDRKHLEYWFTQRSAHKEKERSSPWNQEEGDIPRILDIIMFHRGVQGRSYTVLTHRYQPELDLTQLVRSGYAVLVGRAETPLVELNVNGEPFDETNVRRWTYYRIVYPVAEAEAERNQ
jgi:hypothetical protein